MRAIWFTTALLVLACGGGAPEARTTAEVPLAPPGYLSLGEVPGATGRHEACAATPEGCERFDCTMDYDDCGLIDDATGDWVVGPGCSILKQDVWRLTCSDASRHYLTASGVLRGPPGEHMHPKGALEGPAFWFEDYDMREAIGGDVYHYGLVLVDPELKVIRSYGRELASAEPFIDDRANVTLADGSQAWVGTDGEVHTD